MRGAGGLKVGGGGRVTEKREQHLKKKTREDVTGHFQLGCQMDDFALSQEALSFALCSM